MQGVTTNTQQQQRNLANCVAIIAHYGSLFVVACSFGYRFLFPIFSRGRENHFIVNDLVARLAQILVPIRDQMAGHDFVLGDNWNVCNALVPNVELNNFATLLSGSKSFPCDSNRKFHSHQCPEKSTEITINSAYDRFTF